MNKLLNASIKRIFKIKTMYVCLGVIIFLDALDIIKEFLAAESKDTLPAPDGYLLSGFLMIVLLAAVFISSYLGSEHSYGTLRNKLSVGYSRLQIYFSSFTACYIAVMIMYATVWVLTFSLGTLLLGGFKFTAEELLIKLLVSFLAITTITALYVLIALCVQSKSLGSVVAVIAAFAMMLLGVGITIMLSQPEYVPAVTVSETVYETAPDDPTMVKNPDYISGSKRSDLQLADDLCPVSQMLKNYDRLPVKNVLLSVGELVVLMVAGAMIFKKRDLK